jgi:hypothetical protein
MKSLTTPECIALLKQYGVAITDDERFSQVLKKAPFSAFHTANFPLPKDSGRKVALMRLLFGQIGTDCDVLIWLKNWEVWGSSGHEPLVIRLREALGCNQALDETPGHLFSSAEADDVISFLILSAEFFWDCLVLSSDLRVTLFLSHDEFYSIVCKEQENLARIRDILEKGNSTK